MPKVREFGVGFESLSAREFASHAKRAEEMGFGTFWVPEDPFMRGAFTLAAAVACSTSKMKVGLGIVNPYTRHPSLTAMEFAALDELSGGRAIMGIGTGIKDWIEGRLKIPYTRPASAMREMVEITRALFRGEVVSYAGRVFQSDRMKLNFKPARAGIPIYLGVLGPKNMEMTGEIADGLLLSVMSSPAYVKFATEHLRVGLQKSNRDATDFPVSAYILSSISENERAARDALRPFLAMLISIMAPQPENPIFATAGLAPDTIKSFGESFSRGVVPKDMVTDAMVDTFAIAGSPARCRENLARLVEAGMNAPVFFEAPGVPPQKTFDDVYTHLMPHFS
ncbi:MAG: LLM class flavin-dependent oxidoreductase [Candidatus Binatus sp.]|uniref:LLM class flavin-dependent oxidoreductase n=1 Tax=Candidatus Binatus sp. TaxID=2811406 RepID=UPI00271F4D28|nr:LLM class flavin-dependent oxidoreductase [Candidatus Binatus sp.]MDO8433206.1 LLM class flavin-dependent oxidoreductase [Candidatus Binatus sp.]